MQKEVNFILDFPLYYESRVILFEIESYDLYNWGYIILSFWEHPKLLLEELLSTMMCAKSAQYANEGIRLSEDVNTCHSERGKVYIIQHRSS